MTTQEMIELFLLMFISESETRPPHDGGIIDAEFYTTLASTAVITSQAAGAWLRFVLAKGWLVLSSDDLSGTSTMPA